MVDNTVNISMLVSTTLLSFEPAYDHLAATSEGQTVVTSAPETTATAEEETSRRDEVIIGGWTVRLVLQATANVASDG